MSWLEMLQLVVGFLVLWFMFVPIDKGMGSGYNYPLGIRSLIWICRRLKRQAAKKDK